MKRSDFIRERKIGEFTITLPEPPIETEILNFELEQKKQKWKDRRARLNTTLPNVTKADEQLPHSSKK